MTVCDSLILAERLSDFFRNLDTKGFNVSKNMARNVLKKPERNLENGSNVGTAFASRKTKAALSSLAEMIILYHTRKRLYLGKNV